VRTFVCVLCSLCVLALEHRTAGQAGRFVRSQLTWFDRTGKKLSVVGNMADYGNVELSPNGDKVAVAVLESLERGTRDIWIVEAATGAHAALTSEPGDENWALWSRDGRRLVFNSSRNGGLDLYQGNLPSAGLGEPILVDDVAKWPVSWSADGRYMLYVVSTRTTGNDIMVLPLFGAKKPYPFKDTRDHENWASFSPDGKWVAYSSTESGPTEVYVSAFPPPASGRKWLISKGGGSQARWRRDGRELYFLSTDRQIVAADVSVKGADFEVNDVKPLFDIKFPYAAYHAFDVTADGQRFLVNSLVTSPGSSAIAH
jgi:Tol biopolymer transport system component